MTPRRIFTPRPYNIAMIEHQLEHARGATWAGMGLGKTVSSLNAMMTRELVDGAFPALVLGPARVAESTWSGEAAKWEHLHAVRVLPIVGEPEQRRAQLARPGEIYTLSYDNLPWLMETLEGRWPFRTVYPDESTKLKNLRISDQVSKNGKEFTRSQGGSIRARAIARVAHTKVVNWQNLTGTPSPNGLIDLWGQTWPLDGGKRLGRTYESFKQRWFRPKHDGRGVEPLPHADAEIHERLRDICLSLDARDYFDLREPIVNVIYADLPRKARQLYTDMEKRMFLELEGRQAEAFNAASRTMKCLQLANGAIYLDPDADTDEHPKAKEWREVHDIKIQALESVVEEAAGAPVLVGYHFKSDLARLQKAFPDGINVGTARGLERAKRGEGRVWFGHPASMGHGVDGLQEHCNQLAFFGHNWNLEEFLQIIERIGPTRQAQSGKDRPVFIHHIVARDTVDEIVMARRESKRAVQDLLMEAVSRRKGKST